MFKLFKVLFSSIEIQIVIYFILVLLFNFFDISFWSQDFNGTFSLFKIAWAARANFEFVSSFSHDTTVWMWCEQVMDCHCLITSAKIIVYSYFHKLSQLKNNCRVFRWSLRLLNAFKRFSWLLNRLLITFNFNGRVASNCLHKRLWFFFHNFSSVCLSLLHTRPTLCVHLRWLEHLHK